MKEREGYRQAERKGRKLSFFYFLFFILFEKKKDPEPFERCDATEW